MTETTRRDDYEGFVRVCFVLHEMCTARGVDLDWAYGMIRHTLHDLKPIYSGYTSLQAIKEFKGLTTLMTREHYNGRANCAKKILNMIETNESSSDIFDFVMESCKVHYTTHAENMELVKYQNNDDLTWEQAYAEAGVKLVRYDGIKNWYEIEGIRYYKSKKELMDIFDVSTYKLDKLISNQGKELMIM